MRSIFNKLFLVTFLIILSNNLYARVTVIIPPDSTSTLLEKTAAIYLIDEGKQFFSQGKSIDALRKFREAYVRDKYSSKAAYWIGKTHYTMSNFGYALKYAQIAESLSEEVSGEIYLLLGEAYHRENKLDSAKINYEIAKSKLSNSKITAFNVNQKIIEVLYAIELKENPINYEKVLMGSNINSGYDDYNPVMTNGGKTFFFSSRRPDTKGGNINPDDQRYFEDVYKSEWSDSLKEWSKATNEVERLNSEGFDAVGHITQDGEAYMTVNTSIIDTKNPTKSSDICISNSTREDRWNTPKPIKNKTINTSYFDGTPTLTADGNTMYFVSGRNGEKSLSDIFVVYKNGRNWGDAKALPATINSIGNETTPFITPDNRYLFFSSDGRKGMGGYDIYVSENKGNEWSEPINLGPEFNTVNDDIHFKYYETLKKAYLATYRLQGNKASMDIFELLLDGWEIPKKSE